MRLQILLFTKLLRVCVCDDEDKRIAELCIECAKFASDEDEPTEAAIVRLLSDIENAVMTSYKKYDPSADEYSLHEDLVSQIKMFYPGLQSTIRHIKRKSASHRECSLRNIKKSLNLK